MPQAPFCGVLFHQRFYSLKPLDSQGVADAKLRRCKGLNGTWDSPGWGAAPELTQKHALLPRNANWACLGRLDHGLIQQQDGDAVPDGIHPVTLTALQALAFVLQDQALLTHRADQNFQQLWGDHGRTILLPEGRARVPRGDKMPR